MTVLSEWDQLPGQARHRGPEQIARETAMPVTEVVRIIGELENVGLAVRDGARWVKVRT